MLLLIFHFRFPSHPLSFGIYLGKQHLYVISKSVKSSHTSLCKYCLVFSLCCFCTAANTQHCLTLLSSYPPNTLNKTFLLFLLDTESFFLKWISFLDVYSLFNVFFTVLVYMKIPVFYYCTCKLTLLSITSKLTDLLALEGNSFPYRSCIFLSNCPFKVNFYVYNFGLYIVVKIMKRYTLPTTDNFWIAEGPNWKHSIQEQSKIS